MKIFMTRHLLLVAAGVLCSMLTGGAQADATLAQNKGCLTCHHSDKNVIGPAFKDVATRYQNDKDAAAMLAKKIKDGGKGAWGDAVMPPNPHVNDADSARLVVWILGQK